MIARFLRYSLLFGLVFGLVWLVVIIWWDGKDFGINPNHAKRVAGFRYGDPSHNIFKVTETSHEVIRYWMSRDEKGHIVQGKERGRYSVVWVSTAAHGDTIFWTHDADYLTAEGGKAYR